MPYSFKNNMAGKARAIPAILVIILSFSCAGCDLGINTGTIPNVDVDQAWSIPLPYNLVCHGTVDGDILYVPLVWGLAAIDLKTGSLLWKTDGITETASNPVRLGDELFYIERNPVDIPFAEYKERIARFGLDGSFKGYIGVGTGKYLTRMHSLAAKGEYLYWATAGYNDTYEYPGFVRLHIPSLVDNGDGTWTGSPETLYENGTQTFDVPYFENGTLYLFADERDWHLHIDDPAWVNSRIVKMDEGTGQVLGDYPLPWFVGGNTYQSIVPYEDDLVVNGTWGFLKVTKDGYVKKQWKKDPNGKGATRTGPSTQPTIFDKYLLYSDTPDGTLFPDTPNIACFNMETMRPQWYHVYPDSLGSTPQTANGICYVTTMNETLLFNLKSGAKLGKDERVKGNISQLSASYKYGDLMVYFDNYGVSALKMNFKLGFFGGVEKAE